MSKKYVLTTDQITEIVKTHNNNLIKENEKLKKANEGKVFIDLTNEVKTEPNTDNSLESLIKEIGDKL